MEGIQVIDATIRGRVEPHIYAFRTLDVPSFTKVGDTYRPVDVRLNEWRSKYKKGVEELFRGSALVNADTYFRDYAVHRYLEDEHFHQLQPSEVKPGVYYSNEFYRNVEKEHVNSAIEEIKADYGNPNSKYTYYNTVERLPEGRAVFNRDADWQPRKNQKEVIDNFISAYNAHRSNLLMYAVMRFGKTFTSLCCAKAMNAKLVVVVSGKSAVADEWRENVQRPKIFKGYHFVSAYELDRNRNIISKLLNEDDDEGAYDKKRVVVFLTLQDLLQVKARHSDLFQHNQVGHIDLLIIDETHFAARSEQTGKVLNGEMDEWVEELDSTVRRFRSRVRLHLSGTPYRILMNHEFEEQDIIARVQYNDIHEAQQQWYEDNLKKSEEEMEDDWKNPYYGFPQMVRFAFNLNDSARQRLDELKKAGKEYQLSVLFDTKSVNNGDGIKQQQFLYRAEVLELLQAIDGSRSDSNIFSFLDYEKIQQGEMCHHMVMVLPSRNACDAMETLLKEETANHSFHHLQDYNIINISGNDGPSEYKGDDYSRHVKDFIAKSEQRGERTITLTVGKMLTGSTVREWDTMIFLKGTSSPQEYDQAIYRLQSQYVQKILTTHPKTKKEEYVVRDMKPQTLLVDFDLNRMFKMQRWRTLISNAIHGKKGNTDLKEQLDEDLNISPIITIDNNAIQRVTPVDIINKLREYDNSKSLMDTTADILIDNGVFDDDLLKALIEKQPELKGKVGIFSSKPFEEEGSDADIPDAGDDKKDAKQNKDSKEKKPADELKSLKHRLQTYYFKILLFAYLSDLEEQSLDDVIRNIQDPMHPECRRITRHLELDLEGLKLIRRTANHLCLADLDNKIHNVDTLSGDKDADIQTAMRRFSRLSDNIITTPPHIAAEMVGILPDDVTANSRFLNIAGKTGEFENALINRYGDDVKPNIYTLPINGVTYECTLKMYKLLGIPTKNILNFSAFDLIDPDKKQEKIKILQDMNYDVCIGNPPYNRLDGGAGVSAVPIYPGFVDAAKKSNSHYISMIMPAKWYNGGRGLDEFRETMLHDKQLKMLHDYADTHDCFPTVDVAGGVCHFLRDRKYEGLCKFVSCKGEEKKATTRDLSESEVLIRFGEEVDILDKIQATNPEYLSSKVYSQKPFGLRTYVKPIEDGDICLRYNGGMGAYKRELITTNSDLIDKWKIITSCLTAEHAGETDKNGQKRILSTLEILEPGTICTETYMLLSVFDSKEECVNMFNYLKTRFVRELIAMTTSTQHMAKANFRFVPLQDFSRPWTEKDLYTKYKLTDKDIKFIEAMIKPMD